LIVTIEEAAMPHQPGPNETTEQTLSAGSPLWIARGGQGRVLKNKSDKEMHVVTVTFEP
jgi:hypothetical protein